MTLPKFEYLKARSVADACRLLMEKGPGARVMAGGTDLLVKMRLGPARPTAVIGIKGIKGLGRITFDKDKGLTIGAAALLADVAAHPRVRRLYPAVACAAEATATVQIRNMGTVVGNLCNAAPSADNAPALIALGAQVLITGPAGQRRLPLEAFFRGPGITALQAGEIVTAVQVPPPTPSSGASYQHISARGKVDIAAVCVGAHMVLKGDTCQEVRIALGAVGPLPMRALAAEAAVRGGKITRETLAAAGLAAQAEARPISDVRASAEYRHRMVGVLTRRALEEAHQRAIAAR